MLLGALLVLGDGPLDWAFPWWVWLLAIVEDIGSTTGKIRQAK
jgi:hypothetical protein